MVLYRSRSYVSIYCCAAVCSRASPLALDSTYLLVFRFHPLSDMMLHHGNWVWKRKNDDIDRRAEHLLTGILEPEADGVQAQLRPFSASMCKLHGHSNRKIKLTQYRSKYTTSGATARKIRQGQERLKSPTQLRQFGRFHYYDALRPLHRRHNSFPSHNHSSISLPIRFHQPFHHSLNLTTVTVVKRSCHTSTPQTVPNHCVAPSPPITPLFNNIGI